MQLTLKMRPAVAAVLLLLSACSPRLISDYDETTDRSVTELQRMVESFLTTLERDPTPPACEYARQRQFYHDASVAISALALRNEIRTHNEITNAQIGLLKKSLDALERLHQTSCLSPLQVQLVRDGFNQSFRAILKLELAKQRGG